MTDATTPDSGDDHSADAVEDLRAHLRADPALVTGDPALMAAVRDALAGADVVDLGQRARAKLERELARAKAANEALIALAKANLAVQAQVHGAVLAVMEADSLAALDRKLSGRAAGALGVDILRVFIEGHAPLKAGAAIQGCAPELVDALLGDKADRLGPVDTRFADALYGPMGPGVRSEALARLDIGGRPGVLCLGARDGRAFTPDMAADLLHFFARALERRIAPWLKG
ncbi:MAG: DUF484 family protein [Oceanicaulis sp.]